MHLFLISDTGNTILHPLDVRGTELGEWPGDADTDSDVEAAIADASDASGVEMVFAGFTGSDTVLVREGGEGAA